METPKEKTVDRRIQKTKRALTEALINLILKNGYEKVTVQNIIDAANVGRSTFYLHYESKEQLLLDGHNNLNVQMFSDETDNDSQEEITFVNMFNHLSENKQLAKAMVGSKGGSMMREFIKNNITLKIKKKFRHKFGKSDAEQKLLKFLSEASGAAVLSILVLWIDDETPFSTEEIANKSQAIVVAIFGKFVANG